MENFRNLLLGAGLAVAALTSCAGGGQSAVETVSGLNPANFDTTLNGKKTELITIKIATAWRCASPIMVAA